jgi:hypothetical protein
MQHLGWRFWLAPSPDGALLGPCRGEEWKARESCDFDARCIYPDHQPPVDGCGCGVYAWANLVDTLAWMRCTYRHGWAPTHIRSAPTDPRPFIVLGQVTLWDAIECQPHARWLYDDDGRRHIVHGPKALAGSRARVEELWIACFTTALAPYAPALRDTLATRWGILVTIGEPGYTSSAWERKESGDELCAEFGLFPPAQRQTAGIVESASGEMHHAAPGQPVATSAGE